MKCWHCHRLIVLPSAPPQDGTTTVIEPIHCRYCGTEYSRTTTLLLPGRPVTRPKAR